MDTDMPGSREELRAWAVLVRAFGLTYEHVAGALKIAGCAADLVRSSCADLRQYGFPEAACRSLQSPDWAQADRDLKWLSSADRHLVPLSSPFYPPLLANSGGAPVALYVQGSQEALLSPQLAIVGSRKPTAGGRQTAEDFAAQLARCGLTITSGLAEGIDGAGHQGALACGGLTIAVCGTGLDHVYPARHAELARRIAARGALISEFAPDIGARRENFPRRNRLISGLSVGTLVVEAAKQSGSLITARLAAEQGREVFAVPGSIHNPMARGCHELIRQGAKLVETADDILAELRVPLAQAVRSCVPATTAPDGQKIDNEYEILLDALAFDPVDIGTLARRSGLKPEAVASMLLLLELKGMVETRPGGRYCRTANKPSRAGRDAVN